MKKKLFLFLILTTITFAQNVDSTAQANGWIKISPVYSTSCVDTVYYIDIDHDGAINDTSYIISYGYRARNKNGVVLFQGGGSKKVSNLFVLIEDWDDFIATKKNKILQWHGYTEIGY